MDPNRFCRLRSGFACLSRSFDRLKTGRYWVLPSFTEFPFVCGKGLNGTSGRAQVTKRDTERPPAGPALVVSLVSLMVSLPVAAVLHVGFVFHRRGASRHVPGRQKD